jgi:chromosome segregation ATPase
VLGGPHELNIMCYGMCRTLTDAIELCGKVRNGVIVPQAEVGLFPAAELWNRYRSTPPDLSEQDEEGEARVEPWRFYVCESCAGDDLLQEAADSRNAALDQARAELRQAIAERDEARALKAELETERGRHLETIRDRDQALAEARQETDRAERFRRDRDKLIEKVREVRDWAQRKAEYDHLSTAPSDVTDRLTDLLSEYGEAK